MPDFTHISQPTLLLDRARCTKNIRVMAAKARKHQLIFRPHFKTHQSAGIAQWFRDEGVHCITVSSVAMAIYFADHGWDDITIAFPVNLREIAAINELAPKVRLNLLLDNPETARLLGKLLKSPAGVFIEIDTGGSRSGIPAGDLDIIEDTLEAARQHPNIVFKGFLTHAGHTYQARGRAEVLKLHDNSLAQMLGLKSYFAAFQPLISIGDTPSCSLAGDFRDADEIRPGNFVFYDLSQAVIGSCSPDDIAVALACPVVGKYPERAELVVYGGAIHLSKDALLQPDGTISFGRVALLSQDNWELLPPSCYVKSLSQEHGVVRMESSILRSIIYGSLIAILPVHSCLTAHQMKRCLTLDGEWLPMMNG